MSSLVRTWHKLQQCIKALLYCVQHNNDNEILIQKSLGQYKFAETTQTTGHLALSFSPTHNTSQHATAEDLRRNHPIITSAPLVKYTTSADQAPSADAIHI